MKLITTTLLSIILLMPLLSASSTQLVQKLSVNEISKKLIDMPTQYIKILKSNIDIKIKQEQKHTVRILRNEKQIRKAERKKQLEKLGHTVVAEAENGFESIAAYKKHKPDAVTMDITMPEVNGIGNGISALEEIKKIDPDAKVIMITSHGEQKLVIEAISKGSKGYVLKPVTQVKLEDVLGKLNL